MILLIREDGCGFASCSVEHAIEIAVFLEGLDVAYRYRPKRIEPRGDRMFICMHCGLCGTNCFPEHRPCNVHLVDGLSCPNEDWTSTVAFVYGAVAATSYDPSADLDKIERLVEDGAWRAPDALVYEIIQRYRPNG